MPELPEIVIIATQMKNLSGKTIRSIEIFQEKCLNRSQKDFHSLMPQKRIMSVHPLGKWIVVHLSDASVLFINLGMGGEICFFNNNENIPEKSRLIVHLTDETGFFITLWWFGYFHLVLPGERHPMTDTMGPDPLEMTKKEFHSILEGRKGQIKPFLLNQRRICGIGNYYIQEILYKAKLHPNRIIPSLIHEDIGRLYGAIRDVFNESIALGSSSYELDFYGKRGRYGEDQMAFAYQEGALCPACHSPTKKIKTGSNMQYICPVCQPL